MQDPYVSSSFSPLPVVQWSSAPYLAGGGTDPAGTEHGAANPVAPVLHALVPGDQGHGYLLQAHCQGLG